MAVKKHNQNMSVAEMRMYRWMSGDTLKDRKNVNIYGVSRGGTNKK